MNSDPRVSSPAIGAVVDVDDEVDEDGVDNEAERVDVVDGNEFRVAEAMCSTGRRCVHALPQWRTVLRHR